LSLCLDLPCAPVDVERERRAGHRAPHRLVKRRTPLSARHRWSWARHITTYRTADIARRMSAPPPPSVTASGEVAGSDSGRRGEHPGTVSVAWMPSGRACQQPAFTVSDVRRSQRTTGNSSIKSLSHAQDSVPILVTGLPGRGCRHLAGRTAALRWVRQPRDPH